MVRRRRNTAVTVACVVALVVSTVASDLAGAQFRRGPGCDSDLLPARLPVAGYLATAVIVCSSTDGTSLSVKNVSAGVLRVTPVGLTTWTNYTAPTGTLSWQAVKATVAGGRVQRSSLYSAFDLRPDEAVQANGLSEPVRVYLDLLFAASATAYFARYVADWVQGLVKRPLPRGYRLGLNFRTCVEEVAATVRQRSAIWEDVVRGAVLSVAECGTFAQDVLKEVDEVTSKGRAAAIIANDMAAMADDAGRRAWSFRTAFDDLITLAKRVGSLFAAAR